MTYNELINQQYKVSSSVRALRTVTMLLYAATRETHSIKDLNDNLPELLDISTVLFTLADQANSDFDALIEEMPSNQKGLTP
jgi:hypothetical protein